MKKRLMSILLTLCMVLTLLPIPAIAADKVTAVPSQTNFVMNGQPVSVTAAYSINNTNYLQLRAIAAMLNGTAAQFNVGWDGQYAVIEPGKPYSGAITVTKLQNTTNVRQSGTKFKMNDEVFTFADARLINGDTNYLQLREFAQKLSGTASQFNLYWDGAAGQAVLEPGKPYTGNAPQSGGNASAIEMAHIPAGTFALAGNRVEVTLTKGFYIGKYEVTQEQYQAVMGVNPSYFDGSDDNWVGNVLSQMPDGSWGYSFDLVKSSDGAPKGTVPGEVQARRPVESLSWYDALVFCNRLSILSNLTPVYSINGKTDPAAWGPVPTSRNAAWDAVKANWQADGYRLPTEVEWEVASRAGTKTQYSYGDSADKMKDYAWSVFNSSVMISIYEVGFTRQVGLKLPNPWGLYDMYGNVDEWCWDLRINYPYPVGVVDPVGPTADVVTNSGVRIIRGGSSDGTLTDMGTRSLRGDVFHRSMYVGLRVVKNDGNPRIAPPTNPAGHVPAGHLLVNNPYKQVYKVGDGFDITDLVVHYMDKYGNLSVVDNSKLTFITSGTVQLTQSRPFTTAGVKVVEVQHNGKKVGTFEVRVIEDNTSNILEDGDYYMQINGKYLGIVYAGGHWMELTDKKPAKPFTVRMMDYSNDRGPRYTISYDGMYVMQPSSRSGDQLQASIVPHMWRINKYSTFCTIRDYGNQSLLVVASGGSSANGTKVAVGSYTGSAPDRGKINFIPASAP